MKVLLCLVFEIIHTQFLYEFLLMPADWIEPHPEITQNV